MQRATASRLGAGDLRVCILRLSGRARCALHVGRPREKNGTRVRSVFSICRGRPRPARDVPDLYDHLCNRFCSFKFVVGALHACHGGGGCWHEGRQRPSPPPLPTLPASCAATFFGDNILIVVFLGKRDGGRGGSGLRGRHTHALAPTLATRVPKMIWRMEGSGELCVLVMGRWDV